MNTPPTRRSARLASKKKEVDLCTPSPKQEIYFSDSSSPSSCSDDGSLYENISSFDDNDSSLDEENSGYARQYTRKRTSIPTPKFTSKKSPSKTKSTPKPKSTPKTKTSPNPKKAAPNSKPSPKASHQKSKPTSNFVPDKENATYNTTPSTTKKKEEYTKSKLRRRMTL